ncbi:hypothetical protein F2P56_034653, partial [Juglans regia]
ATQKHPLLLSNIVSSSSSTLDLPSCSFKRSFFQHRHEPPLLVMFKRSVDHPLAFPFPFLTSSSLDFTKPRELKLTLATTPPCSTTFRHEFPFLHHTFTSDLPPFSFPQL